MPPVQPEQLRLMTYLALSAGYRGLGFLGDADLTGNDGPGRALWIEMSFLNLEIDLCEQILAENDTSDPLVHRLRSRPPSRSHPMPTSLPSKKPPKKPELKPRGELRGRGRGPARPQGMRSCSWAIMPRGPSFSRARWPWTSS